MSRAKLAAARELIQEKQYEAARAVLETVEGDPVAADWLAKLDRIAPRQTASAGRAPAPAKDKRRRTIIVLAVLLVLVVIIVAMISNMQARSSEAAMQVRLSIRLMRWCNEAWISAGLEPGDYCSDFGHIYQDNRQVRVCHEQSPELDAPFRACLIGEGINP